MCVPGRGLEAQVTAREQQQRVFLQLADPPSRRCKQSQHDMLGRVVLDGLPTPTPTTGLTFLNSSKICRASSRVGVSTSAPSPSNRVHFERYRASTSCGTQAAQMGHGTQVKVANAGVGSFNDLRGCRGKMSRGHAVSAGCER